jgi:hypothetical protein
VALAVATAWPRPHLTAVEGDAPRRLGHALFAGVAPRAVIWLADYNLLFLAWYLQTVEGLRPDVAVVFRGFGRFAWARERVRRAAPDVEGLLDGRPPPGRPLYLDHELNPRGLGPLRARLREAGMLLVADPSLPDRPLEDLRPLAGPLDPHARRLVGWLHFRRACYHHARGRAEAAAAQVRLAAAVLGPEPALADPGAWQRWCR